MSLDDKTKKSTIIQVFTATLATNTDFNATNSILSGGIIFYL